MVFGLFEKGKVELKLEKTVFSFGDSIKGTIKLQLNKPIMARGVNISLFAEQKTFKGGAGVSFGSSTSFGSRSNFNNDEVERIFDFKTPLDGEKEYGTQPYEYSFELKIPTISQTAPPQGFVGDFAKAMAFLSNKRSVVSWYVEANLDIPKGFDVSKKVQINVG